MTNKQAGLAPDIVGGLIGGGVPVAMHHPDGGCCDLYETDADKRLIVPAADVPAMLEHGFMVAGDAA